VILMDMIELSLQNMILHSIIKLRHVTKSFYTLWIMQKMNSRTKFLLNGWIKKCTKTTDKIDFQNDSVGHSWLKPTKFDLSYQT